MNLSGCLQNQDGTLRANIQAPVDSGVFSDNCEDRDKDRKMTTTICSEFVLLFHNNEAL